MHFQECFAFIFIEYQQIRRKNLHRNRLKTRREGHKNVDSGKMILWQHKELECASEFEDALKEYFDVLLGKELSR